MNLKQAYQGWQQQSQNRELYVKTREAFRKAWFTLPTNKPCSYYTKEVLGTALAETREIESNKAKAASVMCHVLTWAHWAEPNFNPKIDFTYNDLMEYTKGPLADPEKIKPAEKLSCLDDNDDDNDLDIDPVTVVPRNTAKRESIDAIKVRNYINVPELDLRRIETNTVPEPCDEHGNALPENNKTTNETKTEKIMEPKKKMRGRMPKPVAQINVTSLEVIKIWPSMAEAQAELGIFHVDVAVSKLRKAGGFYWSLAADADTFKERLATKQQKFRSKEEKKKNAKAAKLLAKAKAEQKAKKDAEAHEAKKSAARKTVVMPSPAIQVAVTPNPTPSSVTEQKPTDEQPVLAAPNTLETFTDDELLEELDRRGWLGELRRVQVVSIGKD